jgi:hypothetical protein
MGRSVPSKTLRFASLFVVAVAACNSILGNKGRPLATGGAGATVVTVADSGAAAKSDDDSGESGRGEAGASSMGGDATGVGDAGMTGTAGLTGAGGNLNGDSSGGTSGGVAIGGGAGSFGASGMGGGPPGAKLPCDIYAAEGGPCVAAHSTVRALLAAYNGPLYQVRRADGTTKDISVVSRGGFADSSVQDTFCGASTCTISIIYDQSGRGNHLTKTPPGGGAQIQGDTEADAKALPIIIGGKTVYGEHNPAGVGYRNNAAVGLAKGDNAETEYMITSGDYVNSDCCFEYGNMEANTHDNGYGTAEAIYFGKCTSWGRGGGSGPWVMGDLENGLWPGNVTPSAMNISVSSKFVTAMLKGDAAGKNHWAIKAGNAQVGGLTLMFEGQRPSSQYNPMQKEGAVGLGTGGDNSNRGQGNFFEGMMTAHYSTNAADDAVQANIVSVYGQ